MADVNKFRNLYPKDANNFKVYLSSFHPFVPQIGSDPRLIELFSAIFQAISNNGSNRKVEWQEYKKAIPKGYSYSQFATLFSRWCGENRLSIGNRHWGIKKFLKLIEKH
jgi:hypothetical protein